MTFLTKTILIILIFSFLPMTFPNTASAATLTRPPNNLGLVGYWPMDEGVGTQVGDMSGNGNNGSITGASWTNGKRGKALSFNGSGNYSSLPTTLNSSISSETEITIVGWFKGSLIQSMVRLQYTPSPYIVLGWGTTNPRAIISTDGGTSSGVIIGGNVQDGNWHQVIMTWKSNTINGFKVYVDGVVTNQRDSANVLLPNLSGVSYFGTYVTGSEFTNGVIDDVRIYNRALTASEVSSLYSSGQITRKVVSNTGLVGYWSMNEGRGAQAGDSSGNGNTGSLESGITWTDGKKGKALQFSGAGLNTSLPTTIYRNSFTASAWFKTTASADQKIISNNISYHQLQTYSGKLRICVNGCTLGSTSINDGQWHFALVVGDATSIRAYLDGNLTPEITQTATAGAMTGIFSIGKTGNGVGNLYFTGSIDDVRIYNRALSASEIQTLYKQNETKINSSQNNKLTNGLVGMWSFNGQDVSGTTAYDRSGSGNNGTITGAKTTIGKVGQGMSFDGVGDYVNTSYIQDGVTAYTVSVWVKTIDAGREKTFVQDRGSGAGKSLTLGIGGTGGGHGGSGKIGFELDSNGIDIGISSIQTIDDGNWHHVVGTWSAPSGTAVSISQFKIYIDGVNVPVTTGSVGSAISPLTGLSGTKIGRHDAWNTYFNGSIDEVRIYNRALSASEVKRLYDMGK